MTKSKTSRLSKTFIKEVASLPRIDIDQPRYDQSTFFNRFKHFFLLCNPLNLLASNAELERSRRIVQDYRAGRDVPDVKSVDELWRAKYLYDSAFHPDTGEKNILIGRMSAQMPMNALITGCMLVFYKSTPAAVFWQWVNQTFNAIVNYSNRSGAAHISNGQLLTSYVLASGGAMSTAIYLNRLTKNMTPLLGRFVPFLAVAAGNCINIPLMRMQEIKHGVELMDERNNLLAHSRKAAIAGISAVVCSRIAMAVPSMTMVPVIMQSLEKRAVFKNISWLKVPTEVGSVGFILLFATPMGCAFFSQRASIKVSSLEPEVQAKIQKYNPSLTTVWYNKGL